MRLGELVLATTLVGFAYFESVSAERHTECVDSGIRVVASDAALADRICKTVSREKPKLESCHLSPGQPLEILVRDGSAVSGYLAHFNPKKGQILVLAPEQLTEHLAGDSPFRAIPLTHLFESIIAHELTHAFFAMSICGQETCLAGHEYLAFAMQIESLPTRSRELLLETHPATGPIELSWFNDTRLRETPDVFALNAWRHFSQVGNGCNFVEGLVLGEIVFPSEFE